MRLRQNGRHFPDDIFRCIFLNENVWISIKFSLKFVPKVRINNIPALVQIMAWRRQWGLVYWRIYASLGLNESNKYVRDTPAGGQPVSPLPLVGSSSYGDNAPWPGMSQHQSVKSGMDQHVELSPVGNWTPYLENKYSKLLNKQIGSVRINCSAQHAMQDDTI